MASLQDQISEICKLADGVIANPSIDVQTTATNLGLSKNIIGFAAGAVFVPFIIALGPIGWLGGAVAWIYKKMKDNEKAQQEKERMLRQIIAKQQAVIKELNKKESKNQQEIANLKRMLDMLNEAEEKVKAA